MYDTIDWVFGAYSVPGRCGTCQAEHANDVGSPGRHCDPVPLSILEQPANSEVCAGTTAVISVKAAGFPRPHYQWFFNGQPVWGATASSLWITNTTPADAGLYEVEMDNGLETIPGKGAVLTVSTRPMAPLIVSRPVDFEIYDGQTARFSVTVCAFPLASFQWYANGILIPGATDTTLIVPFGTLDLSGTEYRVAAINALGSNSASARLTVITKPVLFITEMMIRPSTDCPDHHAWFDLTNYGTNVVNLRGYRFSDNSLLEGSQVIQQPVAVQPGESVILAKRVTPDGFRQWWGSDNLPPSLQIIPWDGFTLNESSPVLYVWNAAAEDLDYVAAQGYTVATPGVSASFDCASDPNTYLCVHGLDNVVGQLGAFRSAQCGDIGSPGYTTNPPPRLLAIERDASGVTVKWRAVEGKTYMLTCNDGLNPNGWTSLNISTATNSIQRARDATPNASGRRFYRVQELP